MTVGVILLFWGASNSGLPTRYLRDPVEDLIQRIVTAVRTIPCQEEIYVQAGILQLGGESNRYREGRASVAGAVSHIRQASYSIGEYLFTPESAKLLHQPTGEVTLIPRREADILQLLCKGGGNIIPTQNILLSLWGDDDFFNARSLQVLITRLRHRFFRNPRMCFPDFG